MSTDVIKQSQNKNNKQKEKKMRPPKRKRSFSLEKRRAIAGYIFVSPWIIGFLLFMAYPLVTSFIFSLSRVKIRAGKVDLAFVGLRNYKEIFTQDREFLPLFWETIQRTLIWTPFIVVFALFIAMLLNKKIKFRGVFRLIYFLPVLLGTGYVFTKLSGVTEYLTMPRSLVRSLLYIMPSLGQSLSEIIDQILGVFWKTGVQIIIFLAGLQSIPDTLYEAAKFDNSNSCDMFWKITLPMLSPVIVLNTIYTIIASFRDESNPLVNYIIQAFGASKFDATTTMGWMYFIVIFIIIGLTFLFLRRSVYYEK